MFKPEKVKDKLTINYFKSGFTLNVLDMFFSLVERLVYVHGLDTLKKKIVI